MSHIVSLRSASLLALRSSSTVAATSKCATYPNRPCQQQYSYSTLPPSPNRTLLTENNKSSRRVRERDYFHIISYLHIFTLDTVRSNILARISAWFSLRIDPLFSYKSNILYVFFFSNFNLIH
jgi:hypothetical protein